MLKFVLYQEVPEAKPCAWFVISRHAAVIVDKIIDPARAKIMKLDVDESTKADIILERARMKMALGEYTVLGGSLAAS